MARNTGTKNKYYFPIELTLDELRAHLWYAMHLYQAQQDGAYIEGGNEFFYETEKKGWVYRMGEVRLDREFRRARCPGNVRQREQQIEQARQQGLPPPPVSESCNCNHVPLPIEDAGLRNMNEELTRQWRDSGGQFHSIFRHNIADQPMCSECRKMKHDKTGKRIK